MSSAGTWALFRRTKKYNHLFALFITSLTWLFHLRLHEIVMPRILADSTVSNTLPSTKSFCLLQSMWVNGRSVLPNATGENQKSRSINNILTIKTTEIMAPMLQSNQSTPWNSITIFNPLILRGDFHLISHYRTLSKSHTMVTRRGNIARKYKQKRKFLALS